MRVVAGDPLTSDAAVLSLKSVRRRAEMTGRDTDALSHPACQKRRARFDRLHAALAIENPPSFAV